MNTKQIVTSINPKRYLTYKCKVNIIDYQGVLLPIFVLVLSEKNPTSGVAIPSAIWPESSTMLYTINSYIFEQLPCIETRVRIGPEYNIFHVIQEIVKPACGA
jgi:hypothetical protein